MVELFSFCRLRLFLAIFQIRLIHYSLSHDTEQTNGLDANRHKVKVYKRADEESPGAMFLVVLEGMVYTVGAIFAAAALYLLNRWYNGQSVPFINGFNAEISASEFEMRPTQRMPITPDEFRT